MSKCFRISFLSLNIFSQVGGVQKFNKYFVKALVDNNFLWTSHSLHDLESEPELYLNAYQSRKIMFAVDVLRESVRSDIVIWGHVSLGILLPVVKLFSWRGRHVLIVHGTEAWAKKLPLRKKLSFFLFDEVWAVSEYTRERMIAVHSLRPEQVKVLHNCVEVGNALGGLSPFEQKHFNILTVMRLDRSIKLASVVRVMDLLSELEEIGLSPRFTIIGDGDGRFELEEHAREKGVEHLTFFLGYVKDLNPFFEHCDVFTLISEGEGFGIVYIEAMEFAKPCVAAKNSGASDVVIDGVTGFLVDSEKTDELAGALKKLGSDRFTAESMGKAGRIRLEKLFTYDSFKRRQKNLIESALGSSGKVLC